MLNKMTILNAKKDLMKQSSENDPNLLHGKFIN